MDETRLADASTGQWQKFDELLDSVSTEQRLVVLNAVVASRCDGVEPTLEEIQALTDLVCGRPVGGEA